MWLTLLAISAAIILILRATRSGFITYGKRQVGIATVEYGDIKGVYTVRMTLTHEGATLTRNDTFRRRADAEDFFINYSVDQVLEALEQVRAIIGDKS
jgi:hypothetical protein